MNELQIFSNPAFGEIRTLEEHGKPLFCGSDIAKALGYSNSRDALSRHCKGVVKRDGVSQTTNQHGTTTQQKTLMSFIPEGDVYRLITHSKLPAAEQFEHWVFDEVLPALRQSGTYSVTPEKKAIAEAKLNNSRARLASMWLKVGALTTPEYKQVCASYASAALSGGKEVIALPEAHEKLYTATEIGAMFGVSSQRIGLLSTEHSMKTDEFGKWFYDKSRYSNKQVQTFKYNEKAVKRFAELLNKQTA